MKKKMITKKDVTVSRRKHSYSYDLEGKLLEPGINFKLLGERGKSYHYIKTVENENGDVWIDCFGGSPSKQFSRSIDPKRINPDSIQRLTKEDS